MSSGCIKVLLALGILTLILSAPQAVKEGLDDSAILDVGQRLGSVEAKVAELETQVKKCDPEKLDILDKQQRQLKETVDALSTAAGSDADQALDDWAAVKGQ